MGNRQGFKPEDLKALDQRLNDLRAGIEADICLAMEKQTRIIQRRLEALEAAITGSKSIKLENVMAIKDQNTCFDAREGTKVPPKPVKARNTPQLTWKAQMNRIIMRLVKDFPGDYPNYNKVAQEIYRKMDNAYGVCLAQCEKDYKRYHSGVVSTLEAISSDEKLRSIFESILITQDSKIRESAEKKKATENAVLGMTRKEIIQPLIEVRGDKSNYGCNTYTVVSHRMRSNGVDFKVSGEAYRIKNKLRRQIKSSELIENDPEIKKAFARAVLELLTEIQKGGDHERNDIRRYMILWSDTSKPTDIRQTLPRSRRGSGCTASRLWPLT